MSGESEPDENAQRKLMSPEDRNKLLASRLMYNMKDFDYSGARDAAFYETRCKKLGYSFPASYYEAFALYDAGMRAKQYRSLLKKQSRKLRIQRHFTNLSFD